MSQGQGAPSRSAPGPRRGRSRAWVGSECQTGLRPGRHTRSPRHQLVSQARSWRAAGPGTTGADARWPGHRHQCSPRAPAVRGLRRAAQRRVALARHGRSRPARAARRSCPRTRGRCDPAACRAAGSVARARPCAKCYGPMPGVGTSCPGCWPADPWTVPVDPRAECGLEFRGLPGGSNSVGRVLASQARCRGFESRLPLQPLQTNVPAG